MSDQLIFGWFSISLNCRISGAKLRESKECSNTDINIWRLNSSKGSDAIENRVRKSYTSFFSEVLRSLVGIVRMTLFLTRSTVDNNNKQQNIDPVHNDVSISLIYERVTSPQDLVVFSRRTNCAGKTSSNYKNPSQWNMGICWRPFSCTRRKQWALWNIYISKEKYSRTSRKRRPKLSNPAYGGWSLNKRVYAASK